MNNKTLTETQKEKRELEHAIAKLIEEFGHRHGVTVEGCSVDRDPVIMNQQGDVLNKIRYSVELRIWL